MRLTVKWLLWFVSIGIYVMCLGGFFYYNLFKWTFDEKLKQDILDTVKVYAPTVRNGLLSRPRALTLDEYDIMTSLSKDERVISVLYLNRQGIVRWYKEARFIGVPWDEFQKTVPPLTDAIKQAYDSKMPKSRQVANEPFYEIAIPFSVRGEIIGIVDLLVSRAGAKVLIGSAMRKYIFGALGVLFLLGLPLYFFFHHYVVSPMGVLRDSIEAVSLNNLDLRFAAKSDEIGDIAGSISRLIAKMKTEMDSSSSRDAKYKEGEQKWWRSLLDLIVPAGNYVIVVDENNGILHANFPLVGGKDSKNIHLLDVVDSQQQSLLRLVGQAFEAPDQVAEGETFFKNQNMNVKVLHVGDASGISRTLILFRPAASA